MAELFRVTKKNRNPGEKYKSYPVFDIMYNYTYSTASHFFAYDEEKEIWRFLEINEYKLATKEELAMEEEDNE